MNIFSRKLYLLSLLWGVWTCFSCRAQDERSDNIDFSTVKFLDLSKFMGRWYEIARYDHRFEKEMTHVTADYILLEDGKIKVINQGLKNGLVKKIVGKAKQPDLVRFPGRLKVSFFLWFYADYYILELGDEYQYAVIGSSSDKYLWILSRTPQMEVSLFDHILRKIEQRGYDLTRLVFVEQ